MHGAYESLQIANLKLGEGLFVTRINLQYRDIGIADKARIFLPYFTEWWERERRVIMRHRNRNVPIRHFKALQIAKFAMRKSH